MKKLQRYIEEYSGCEPDPQGDFVKFDDVIELLRELADNFDDPNVIQELEENDLNGSVLVNQAILRQS
jgi:hypothetical protein